MNVPHSVYRYPKRCKAVLDRVRFQSSGKRVNGILTRIVYGLLLLLLTAGSASAQSFVQAPPENMGLQLQKWKWMEIKDNPSLVLDVFTVECWVKAQSRFVIVSRDWPGNHLPDWSVVFEASRKRIEFMTGMNSQPDSYFWTLDNSFLPNVWNHLALVVNGPFGYAKVYINGSFSASFNFAARNFSVVTGLAWGGYYANGYGATGNGIIDEARYWKGERTQSEIQSLIMANIPDVSIYPKLHGFWRFCHNYNDSSLRGNHGTPRRDPPIITIFDLPAGIYCDMELTVTTPGGSICAGDTVQLSAVVKGSFPPFTYRWYPDSTLLYPDTPYPLAFPFASTMYYVEVTDRMKNVVLDSLHVEVRPALLIDAGKDVEMCGPADVALFCQVFNGTPPHSYSWMPASTLSALDVSNPLASPTGPGVYPYIVTVSDNKGCKATDTVRVIVHEGVTIDVGPDLVQCGVVPLTLNVDVMSGRSPLRYEWWPDSSLSGGDASSPVATPFQTTMYHVRVIDADGCIGEDSLTVNVYPEVVIEITGDTLLCNPDSVWLSLHVLQAAAPAKVTWSPARLLDLSDLLNPRAFIAQTTTFHVQVVDANGCAAESSITIVMDSGMELVIIADTLLCKPDVVELSLHVLSGKQPVQVIWSPDDSLTVTDISHASVFVWRTTTYHATVIDADGCVGEQEITVTVLPELILSLDSVLTICHGDDAVLQALVSGGTPPFHVQWEPAALVYNPDQLNTRASCDSVVVFTIRVSDMAGCEVVDSILVRALLRPVVDAGPDVRICPGDSVRLSGTASGGVQPYTWSWTPVNSIIGSPSGQSIIAAPTVTTLYVLLVTTANGCSVYDSVLVTVEAIDDVAIQPPGLLRFCEGDSITLHATAGFARYQWWYNDTLVVGSTSSLTVTKQGQYKVRVWTVGDCTGISDPAEVVVHIPVIPIVSGPTDLCVGDSAVLVATTGYASYRWSTGEENRAIVVNTSGTYFVDVTDDEGCTAVSDLHTIRFHEAPAKPVITRIADTLHSTAAAHYEWYFNGEAIPFSDQAVQPLLGPGSYQVQVFDVFGCRAMSDPYPFINAEAVLALPILEAAPGEIVTIPVTLQSMSNLTTGNVQSMSAQLRVDASLLVPVGNTAPGTFDGEDRLVPIQVESSALFTIGHSVTFMATLGKRKSCALDLDKVEWAGASVTTTIIPGEFRLITCNEGGTRLFDAGARVQLMNNTPNPFRSSTVIEYELIEAGQTRLEVIDALGRVVSTLVDGEMNPGVYRASFQAKQYRPGLYFYRLTTPTILLMKKMLMVH